MKQLKDYLHLYLGCECYYDRTHYAGKLIGVEDDSAFTWDTVNGRVVWPLKRMLPILRPLSDMTEEEMDYALNHISDDGDIPSEDFANLQSYLWHLAEGLNMADMFELTRKLLAKHFDLFGLIEAGLAIDKTTLTK